MDTAFNPDRPDRLATDVAELWTTVREQQQLLETQSRVIATLQRRRRRWSLPSLPGLRVTALVAALLLTLQPGVLLAAAGDSWTTVRPIFAPLDALAAATGADGRIYAIGGDRNGSNSVGMVEAYTPSTDTWAAVRPMPTARFSLAAAMGADGRVYAIGGYNFGPLSTVEAYTALPAPTPGLGAVGQPGIAGYSSSASLLKSPVNAGVYGGSESGVGGWFHSTNGAPLHLDPGATSGPPTTGTFQLGDLYLGSTGVLYLYNGSAWKTLGGGGPTDARLTSVHAVAQGSRVRFSWRVADGKGIAGFAVYAQTHRLNRAMIAVHPARSYQYVGHWTGGGPYSLRVLLSTGRQLTVPVH